MERFSFLFISRCLKYIYLSLGPKFRYNLENDTTELFLTRRPRVLLQVVEEDALPSMVCGSCVRVVEFWQGFKQDCRHNQVFLQENIGLMNQNHPTYTELHQV